MNVSEVQPEQKRSGGCQPEATTRERTFMYMSLIDHFDSQMLRQPIVSMIQTRSRRENAWKAGRNDASHRCELRPTVRRFGIEASSDGRALGG
jgi:hypothetical protein